MLAHHLHDGEKIPSTYRQLPQASLAQEKTPSPLLSRASTMVIYSTRKWHHKSVTTQAVCFQNSIFPISSHLYNQQLLITRGLVSSRASFAPVLAGSCYALADVNPFLRPSSPTHTPRQLTFYVEKAYREVLWSSSHPEREQEHFWAVSKT